MQDPSARVPAVEQNNQRLSYKFQRLREQLRHALESGELSGQLPGERELGKRFDANAKTVNKALSDLASEGLVVRQIGRGTFAVPRSGVDASIVRSRTIRCLLSESSTVPHRLTVVDTVRSLLMSSGHRLVPMILAGAHHQNGHSLLSDWSTSERRETHGLISMPADPLSGGSARLGEGTIGEVVRRHIPTVLIGALSESAKLSSVTPDYMDAGFRLTEHLILSGADRLLVLTTDECHRECELVLSGMMASAGRHQLTPQHVKLPGSFAARIFDGPSGHAIEDFVREATGHRVGVLCVGHRVVTAVRQEPRWMNLHARGAISAVAVLEAGDAAAAEAGMTWYDVEPRRLAEWAVRLLLESHVGDRPVEVMIPGRLRLSGKTASTSATRARETLKPADTHASAAVAL
jgi:DNA-binding LacI/PurR family transcriptional regulator